MEGLELPLASVYGSFSDLVRNLSRQNRDFRFESLVVSLTGLVEVNRRHGTLQSGSNQPLQNTTSGFDPGRGGGMR